MNLELENQTGESSALTDPIQPQTPEGNSNESSPRDPKNSLSLRDRLEVIRLATTEKYSNRRLAEMFKCGRTQIATILREKSKYFEIAKTPGSIDRKMPTRRMKFVSVNERVEKWLNEAQEHNLVVTGPIIQSKAREIASQLGAYHFQASNGWLQSFRKRSRLSKLGQNSPAEHGDNEEDDFNMSGGYSTDNLNESSDEFGEYSDDLVNSDVAVPEVILLDDELGWQHVPSTSSATSSFIPTTVPLMNPETVNLISLREAVRHLEDLKTLAEALGYRNMFQAFTTQETVIKNLIVSRTKHQTRFQNEAFHSPS